MLENKNHSIASIKSFTCRCLVKDGDAFFVETSPQMLAFFGTTEDSYRQGLLARVRKDIGEETAKALGGIFSTKAARGEDFRLVYPSMRADGSRCMMQLDAYASAQADDGWLYDVIEVDITDQLDAQEAEDRLLAQNRSLLEDSPVGLGIYHIKDNNFDLVYTNEEYYHIHHGSRAFWDRFKGEEALNRIIPEDRHLVFEEWERTLADPKGHIYHADYRCLGEDGERHWVRLLARMADPLEDGTRVCYASYLDVDNEKQAEETVHHVSNTLLDTINSLPANFVLFRINNDNSISAETYSDEFCHMIGCTQESARTMNTDNAFYPVHPDDRAWLRAEVDAHLNDKTVSHAVYRILRQGGSYIWVSVGYIGFSVAGKRYLHATYTDIDEIKKEEHELVRQYETAQSYLDSISDTYLAAMRVNISQNKVEVIKGVDPLVTEKEAPRYDDAMEALLASMPRAEHRRECRERLSREALIRAYGNGTRVVEMDYLFRPEVGGVMWARCVINLTRRPGSKDIIAFDAVSDINRTKTIEAIMNTVIVKQYDFIACIDSLENAIDLVSANQQSAAVTEVHGGLDYDNIMREYVELHVVPEEKKACIVFMTLKNVVAALEHTDVYTGSFTVMENGVLRNKRLDYSYIDRETKLITLIRSDFTEIQKKQLEQEDALRRALDASKAASVAKSDFLSRMSHDIRTPLNGIIGMSYLAQEEDNPPKTVDCLQKIDTSSRFLLGLVNDVLDMAKAESNKIELHLAPYPIETFETYLDAVIRPLCEEKGQTFTLKGTMIRDKVPLMDELRVNQVFFNLLSNAVKYTPEGGKILCDVQEHIDKSNRFAVHATVSDNGIGMSEDFQKHLFESFTQEERNDSAENRGSGLGLAIAKKMVDLMGGSLGVESTEGQGSTFTLDLAFDWVPVGKNSEATALGQPAGDGSALAGKRILLCEDHPLNQEITKALLQEKGAIVDAMANGREGLDAFEGSAVGYYDAILMDIRMPVMDGYMATDAIRALARDDAATVPIIAMTADAFAEDVRKCLEHGMNDHLAKPVEPGRMYEVVEQAISSVAQRGRK